MGKGLSTVLPLRELGRPLLDERAALETTTRGLAVVGEHDPGHRACALYPGVGEDLKEREIQSKLTWLEKEPRAYISSFDRLSSSILV